MGADDGRGDGTCVGGDVGGDVGALEGAGATDNVALNASTPTNHRRRDPCIVEVTVVCE
jgi:hypothetical protein